MNEKKGMAYVKLDYIQHALEQVISDSKKMGDHLIDLDRVERALTVVEGMRAYLKELK